MSFGIERPPRMEKDYFLGLFDRILEERMVGEVILCGSKPCRRRPDDGRSNLHSEPRLLVFLQGRFGFAVSHNGTRQDMVLRPKQSVYMASRAWQTQWFLDQTTFFGLVFPPKRMRVILADYAKGCRPETGHGTPWFYTTAQPLGGAGASVLHTLNLLSEHDPQSPAAKDLFIGLLKLARDHLAADRPHATEKEPKAVRTWARVMDYLHDHYSESISRETAAAALGLHPNYLSALASRQTGASFLTVLETLRLDTARRLLQESDMKLAQLATLCGYRTASYFVTAFRRTIGMTPGQYRNQFR